MTRLQRPSPTQLNNLVEWYVAAGTRALESWPLLLQRIKEMDRGFPASSGGQVGGSGGHGDPVGELVANAYREAGEPMLDPTEPYRRAVERLREMLAVVVAVDNELAVLLARRAPLGLRINSVEVCVKCENPAPKVKRIDGAPYCTPGCYEVENRARRTAC